MRHKTSQYPDCPLFNLKILILHAVEQHEKVLILADKRIELRVQVLEHSDTDSILVVSCCSDEESMQKLVDDSFHGRTDSQMARFGKRQATARSHGFFADIWILVVEEVEHGVLDEVNCAHREGLEVEHLQSPQCQGHHLSSFGCTLITFFALVIFLEEATLLNKSVEEVLILFVKHGIVELLQLFFGLYLCRLILLSKFVDIVSSL